MTIPTTEANGKPDHERLYVGLDVAKDETHLCVVDRTGRRIHQAVVPTDPDALAAAIRKRAPDAELIGLEMGTMASWLWRGLTELGLPAITIDARHAYAALSTRMNKSDRNDVQGLAELLRTGWYREVRVRSRESDALRVLLNARGRIVRMIGDVQNQLRGVLKERGLRMPRAVGPMYRQRVREATHGKLAAHDPIIPIVEAFLRLHEQLSAEQLAIDRRDRAAAKADDTIQRLMTIPGVGIVTASSFRHTIDDPSRFTSSSTVGAYLGLTPRRWQSGQLDYSGRISKAGNSAMRALLYEAASVVIHRLQRTCAMKAWAMALVKRIGLRRARVALARKLAVMMHAIWVDGTEFDWKVGSPA